MPPLIEWVVQLKTLFRLWITECKRPAITKLAPPELELPDPAREPPGVRTPLQAELGVRRPLEPAELGVVTSALLTPFCFWF